MNPRIALLALSLAFPLATNAQCRVVAELSVGGQGDQHYVLTEEYVQDQNVVGRDTLSPYQLTCHRRLICREVRQGRRINIWSTEQSFSCMEGFTLYRLVASRWGVLVVQVRPAVGTVRVQAWSVQDGGVLAPIADAIRETNLVYPALLTVSVDEQGLALALREDPARPWSSLAPIVLPAAGTQR